MIYFDPIHPLTRSCLFIPADLLSLTSPPSTAIVECVLNAQPQMGILPKSTKFFASISKDYYPHFS